MFLKSKRGGHRGGQPSIWGPWPPLAPLDPPLHETHDTIAYSWGRQSQLWVIDIWTVYNGLKVNVDSCM